MREERNEVLVVGAGPVGLWTAVVLAESGVQVKIIDQESRTAARSYACALHPESLQAMDRYGLAQQLVAVGRKIDTYAFYEGEARQAEIKLDAVGGGFPYVLMVPQDVLESALEQRLVRAGVKVQWNHRLDTISPQTESIAVSVDELEGTTTGYIVPHWEMVVRRKLPLRAQFVVGADGHNSMTRQRLGINYRKFGDVEAFAAYEFASEEPAVNEVRVVLNQDTTNVLWPLPGNKWRWTFQITPTDVTEFPEKERRAVHVASRVIDDRARDYVQRIAGQRAPWFRSRVQEVTWCTLVSFEQRLVDRFGQGRGWLAGDAAHQTGPVGVQSMNAGIVEGERLARALHALIHQEGDMELLNAYNTAGQKTWQSLFTGKWCPGPRATPWLQNAFRRVVPCVPGLDETFRKLASQLGIEEGE